MYIKSVPNERDQLSPNHTIFIWFIICHSYGLLLSIILMYITFTFRLLFQNGTRYEKFLILQKSFYPYKIKATLSHLICLQLLFGAQTIFVPKYCLQN